MQKKHIEKEWQQMLRAEQAFLNKNMPERSAGWQDKIAKYVPQKLETTLQTAFFKAFELIFDKGTSVIEKTYQKEKKEQNFKINAYAAEIRNTRRSLRAFTRAASAGQSFNMAVSAVEGVGMGLLGMGLPDIPVFLGVLLKSIYEIALSYGFDYQDESEKHFVLLLIQGAFSYGNDLEKINSEVNFYIVNGNFYYFR